MTAPNVHHDVTHRLFFWKTLAPAGASVATAQDRS